MHNAPAGTGGWFGWANAVISELTPTAAGLDIRRRKRQHRSIAYPMTVLIAAAALSLAAQVAEATPSPTGWLLAAVPALAFLALSKLVLSRTADQAPTALDKHPADVKPTAPEPGGHAADIPAGQPVDSSAELPAQLLTSARMAAFAHHQVTGQPITADGLAAHLDLPPALAGTLLHHLDGTGTPGTIPSVAAINGTPMAGSRP
jgi:hypothetical protein